MLLLVICQRLSPPGTAPGQDPRERLLIQNMLKPPGGQIRVTAIDEDGMLRDVYVSGDFFFYSAEGLSELEHSLEGV